MSDPNSAAKLAAERRRRRILAKSKARMSVVSGQASVEDVVSGNKDDSEGKRRRQRRQRPNFMVNSVEKELSTEGGVNRKESDDRTRSESVNIEKTETEKKKVIPATIVGSTAKVEGNTIKKDIVDEADVIPRQQQVAAVSISSTKSKNSTFSSSFRRRARKKKSGGE